ncbi:MAG TPA: FAD-dependent oxidoreductase [Acidimicrobiales bacterium]|nr:FAD-dependent oxidoreductase [Acidimicrobiales bacterium]
MTATFAIIGAGLAGGTAAATLRAHGFAGRLLLIGAEPHPPYERPPLSKQYLRGETTLEAALVRPPEFWVEQGVECRFAIAARSIDTQRHRILLDSGEELPFDQLLISTGLRNRTIPGAAVAGIHYLRTVDEAAALRDAIAGAGRAVVVGMGFIGAEVTAALRDAGVEVTVIEPLPGPVYAALGPEGSAVVEAIHRDHGVTMHFGERVEAFHGNRRLEAVTTTGGRHIPCDLAVIGVGTVPQTEVVQGTGVTLDNGIVVDEYCRTGVEGVYAAGDVANHFHPGYGRHIRVEHWQNALKQGEAAALSMLGAGRPYDEVHWFWSDQYTDNVQVGGRLGSWEQAVIRGDLERRRFVAFFLDGDRLHGALAVNLGRDLRRGLPLLKANAAVDRAILADPAADVRAARRAG